MTNLLSRSLCERYKPPPPHTGGGLLLPLWSAATAAAKQSCRFLATPFQVTARLAALL